MQDNRQTRERQQGYTLLEVLISSVILVSMILVVTSLSKSGSDAERYASRLTRATEICQEIMDELRRGLSSSVRVFHNDAVGNAYANLLDLPATAPRIGSRLPTLRPSGIFEREPTGQQYSGNSLVFARHTWTDTYLATSGRTFNVDVYRVHAYYLRQDGDGLVAGAGIGLNFARFVSEPLADGKQIDAIADATDRRDVLRLLHAGRTTTDLMTQPDPVHATLEVVWRLGEDPATTGTLRQVSAGGTLSNSRGATWKLLRDASRSNDGLVFYRHHSVATNWAPPAYGVGQFSQIDNSGDGFPHGFETQLIGPASARQLLLRMCVVSTNRAGHRAYARQEIIQDCRDI
ncbi:MAG: type II secretion system protein [Planctomycetota bacterium]